MCWRSSIKDSLQWLKHPHFTLDVWLEAVCAEGLIGELGIVRHSVCGLLRRAWTTPPTSHLRGQHGRSGGDTAPVRRWAASEVPPGTTALFSHLKGTTKCRSYNEKNVWKSPSFPPGTKGWPSPPPCKESRLSDSWPEGRPVRERRKERQPGERRWWGGRKGNPRRGKEERWLFLLPPQVLGESKSQQNRLWLFWPSQPRGLEHTPDSLMAWPTLLPWPGLRKVAWSQQCKERPMIPFPEEIETMGPIPGSDSSRKQPRVRRPGPGRGKNQRELEEKGSIAFSSRPRLAVSGTLCQGQLGTPLILSL